VDFTAYELAFAVESQHVDERRFLAALDVAETQAPEYAAKSPRLNASCADLAISTFDISVTSWTMNAQRHPS
jgi:hypothetical protein